MLLSIPIKAQFDRDTFVVYTKNFCIFQEIQETIIKK